MQTHSLKLTSLIEGFKRLGGDRKGIGFPLLKLMPDKVMQAQSYVRLLAVPKRRNAFPSDPIGRTV
jgi:hypothetical protein